MTTPENRHPEGQQFVEVGRILRPWGIRGEMRLEAFGDSPEAFRERKQVFIRGRPFDIEKARPHQGAVILKLAGIDTTQAVDALRGAVVEVPESELPPLPADRYYHYQVLGLLVVTTEGRELGRVDDIFPTGSNDVYVVRGPAGEIMVPAIADVVKQIDLERGVVVIEALPGLLE